MALITNEMRSEFKDKAAPYKVSITQAQAKEKDMQALAHREKEGVEYKKLQLAEHAMYIATLYLSVNDISVHVIDAKNNDALNDARKALYKAIIYLEEVVSNAVDCPYSELADRQEAIKDVPLERRFYLVRKLGLGIRMLSDAFGDNTKWKWSIVDLEGRYAVVTKNFIDMKAAAKDYFEPSSPAYDTTVLYVRLVKKLLEQSATEFRDKYELSSRRIDDMRMGINFLMALRRVAMVLGDKDDAEEIKKKATVWKDKMEADKKAGSSN